MKKIFFFVLCVFPLLSAFSGGKKDTFDFSDFSEIEKKYPSAKYITGTGSGLSRETAESSAKFSLCQTLGETLEGQQQSYIYSDSSGADSSAFKIELKESILFNKITGIQIKECVRDEKGNFTALAVLDKKEASSYYSSKIREADSKIQILLKNARENRGSIECIKFYENAVSLALENEYNLEILSAIDLTQRAFASPSYISTEKINAEFAENCANLVFSIAITGDVGNKISAAVSDILKEKKCTVVESALSSAGSTGAKYIVTGSLSLEPLEVTGQTHKFVRYIFDCKITESSTGKIYVPYNISGREGHLTEEQAVLRAVNKIVSLINEEWKQEF